jgi:cyclic 2,3-diphosphoglycerate synthetase
VRLAAARDPGVIVLEGSGASMPPVAWDAGVLVVPATCPVEYLRGYLGPYRLLRADLAVVTMAGGPGLGTENGSHLIAHLQGSLGDAHVVVTDLRPTPLGSVVGRRAFFATTAPPAVAERQVAHLEGEHGADIVGWSARLGDRAGLAEDLDGAEEHEVLLTELKAAAVDVAGMRAVARGADVVFVDNRPVPADGDDLDGRLVEVLDLAAGRASRRTAEGSA